MKTYNPIQKISLFLSFPTIALLMTSCGSFQEASYYDNDGIYDRDIVYADGYRQDKQNNTSKENVVVTDFENYFDQKEQQLDYIEQQMSENDVFTDIDSYSSENDSIELAQNYPYEYQGGYAGWGDNSESVVLNVYSNNWGWGGFYGPYWGGYYGSYWGWNYWGGWYDPFWYPYSYYGGWAGYYPYGYWGWNRGWYGHNYYYGGYPYYYGDHRYAYTSSRRDIYGRRSAVANSRADSRISSRDYSATTRRSGRATSSDIVNRRGYSNRSNVGVDRRSYRPNSGYIPSQRARTYRYDSGSNGSNSNYGTTRRSSSPAYSGNRSSTNRSSGYSNRSSSSSSRSSGYSRGSSSSSSRSSGSSGGSSRGGGRRGGNQ